MKVSILDRNSRRVLATFHTVDADRWKSLTQSELQKEAKLKTMPNKGLGIVIEENNVIVFSSFSKKEKQKVMESK